MENRHLSLMYEDFGIGKPYMLMMVFVELGYNNVRQ